MSTFGTEKANFTFNFVGGRASRPGTGSLTLLAALDGGASVAANIVRSYRNANGVKTDHGDASPLHLGAQKASLNINRFMAGAWDDVTVDPADYTFGDASVLDTDTLPAEAATMYGTGASIDGAAYDTIIFTEDDPTSLTLVDTGNGSIAINTVTRVFQSSRVTSGAGAGIVFTPSIADLDPLLERVLMHPSEVVTLAGLRYNAQNMGIYKTLIEWADSSDLSVAAASDDNVTKEDFASIAAIVQSDSAVLIAARLTVPTDDLTSGYAALQASSPPHGSLKDQPIPAGFAVDRDAPYTRGEFGDDYEPSVGSFHFSGGNVALLNGTISSDRNLITYDDAADTLFFGTRRTLNAVNALVAFQVENVLTASPTSSLFNAAGLASLKGSILTGLTRSSDFGYIDANFELDFPELGDISESDRKKRKLTGVEYRVRISGVVHTIDFNVEAEQ